MSKIKTVALLTALALLAAGSLAAVLAQEPVPPHKFYGTVMVDGEPASEGTTVIAAVIFGRDEHPVISEIGGAGTDARGNYILTAKGDSSHVGQEITFMIKMGEEAPRDAQPSKVLDDGSVVILEEPIMYVAGALTQIDLVVGPAAGPGNSGCSNTIPASGTFSSKWAAGCASETREGSYARYYTFTLAQDSQVTLTLHSDDADTYLYLRKGGASSGTALHENDDHEGSLNISQIQATLSAGSYTIEATTYDAGETGSFTLGVWDRTGAFHPPNRYAGNAFIDGQKARAGTLIEALSDGILVGSAIVKTLSSHINYVLNVNRPSESLALAFRVGGYPAKETATWQQGAITFPFPLNASSTAGPEPGGCTQTQTITADGSTSSQWVSGCESETREGSYARFYRFTLAQDSEVILTLQSDDADTYLYIRQGEVRSGTALHENDDHEGSTSVSQIRAALSVGTYTIEATTYAAGETGSFTLTVSGLGDTNAPLPSPQPHAGDRAALVALYDATGGSNWVRSEGWGSDAPIDEWHGVSADGGGRVAGLNLPRNGLAGEIPQQLGSLARLRFLNLSGNQLSGEIPEGIGNLTSLEQLGLGDNQLRGEIPSVLGSLANLTELSLSGTELSGEIPFQLGNLANLTELSLDDNQLSGGIPDELGNLVNLKSLALSFNRLSGEIPADLGSLTNLRWLHLGSNQLAGEIPPELGSLLNLESLGLRNNELTGKIPPALGNLTSLRELGLSDNHLSGGIPPELGNLTSLGNILFGRNQLTGEIPPELGDLLNLHSLYLYENELTAEIPSELGNLTNLTILRLDGNQLTGEIPVELSNLPNLIHLYLFDNELTGGILPELGSLTYLETLLLYGNQFTGEIPSELGRLSNLDRLDLSGNQLSGEIPPQLGNLANLEKLYLWNNQLNGEIPAELGSLSALTWLSLADNELSGRIPPELGNLANLDNLYLWNNQLNGEIPAELGSLSSLEELDIGGNQLSGEIPPELGSLSALTWLRLADNELSGRIPPELGNLSNLKALLLRDNRLSGEIPAELGNLKKLMSVAFHGNQLTGCVPSGLRKVLYSDFDELGLPFCQETAPPVDPCLEELSGDGTTSGQWASGCDSTVSERGYARYYSFTLARESEVTIILESSDADTYLYLREGEARSGMALHENDDHEGSLSVSRIQATLAAGSYTIEATTYAAGKTGSFTLTVSGLGSGTFPQPPGPTPTDPCYPAPLQGDTVYEDLWTAGCDSIDRAGSHARYYSFTLVQESEVTITLELASGEADTYLYLREGEARSGTALHENDDDVGTTRSRIQETLDAGTYTIEATTYEAGQTGIFTLTVRGLGSATGPTPSVPALWFDTGSDPFGDIRVRYAISYAIDQELLNELFWDGRGDLQSPVPDALFPQWTTELDDPGVLQEWHLYDLGESRRLLAEAGWPDGFETRVHVLPRWVEWAEVIEEMLAGVGIAVDVVISGPAAIAELGQVSHQAMILAPLQGFGGDMAAFIREHFTDEGQHKYGRSASDVAEEILLEFVNTEDTGKRQGLVYDLQYYLQKDMVLVPLPAPPAPPASTDPCIEPLAGLVTIIGDWDEDACASEVPGRGYARYFSFTVAQASAVAITLESEADTYLYLREGQDRSGEPLHGNDDLESGNTNSRITATLAAGRYTIEATTYAAGETGSFTLTVAGLGGTASPGDARR